MKILIMFFAIALLFGGYATAQTENPDNKALSKEERKALRKAKKEEEKRKLTENLKTFEKLADNKTWVIEAYMVFDKTGQSYQMDPTINFVSVDGNETTVQLSFNGLIGWNGVGGVTLVGNIGKYNVNPEKNSVSVNMSASGSSLGVVDMFITVTGDGNARASISGNWGDRITFQGKFVSLAESSVYKGTTTY